MSVSHASRKQPGDARNPLCLQSVLHPTSTKVLSFQLAALAIYAGAPDITVVHACFTDSKKTVTTIKLHHYECSQLLGMTNVFTESKL